jgi:hypothetical protein
MCAVLVELNFIVIITIGTTLGGTISLVVAYMCMTIITVEQIWAWETPKRWDSKLMSASLGFNLWLNNHRLG